MRSGNKGLLRRGLALLLCLCMVFPLMGTATAAEQAAYTGGPCPHHTEHTADCGYAPAVVGQDCNHVHDENCGYAAAVAEVPCNVGCTDTDGDGVIDHGEGCAYAPAVAEVPCAHAHDESCGYIAPVEEQPCQFYCQECARSAETSPPDGTATPAPDSTETPAPTSTTETDPSQVPMTTSTEGGGTQVNQAVSVSFKPTNPVTSAGLDQSMTLNITVSATEEGSATVTIPLPQGIEKYMTGLTNKNEDGTYTITSSSTGSTGQEITVGFDPVTEAPYLKTTVTNGQTLTMPIGFKFPNGITEPGVKVDVAPENIDVQLNGIQGNIVKDTEPLRVTAGFEWDAVQKTSETASGLSVSQTGYLDDNLVYNITATSQNRTASGEIFTQSLTITDTMTLPDRLNFTASGELTVSQNGDTAYIRSGALALATVTGVANGTLSSARIEGKDLILTYTQTASYNELSEYTSEMAEPSLKVTVDRSAVRAEDITLIDGTEVITNKAEFSATAVFGETEKSQASVQDSVTKPSKDFTIDKASSVAIDDDGNGMTITYQVTVTNTGTLPLTGFTVTDTLPDQVELTEAQRLVVSGQGGTVSEDGRTITWANQTIPSGGTFTRIFSVNVKDGVDPGTQIVNTATGTDDEGRTKQDTATDVATSPDARIQMSKSHDKDRATVYDGDPITYTIQVTNNGLTPTTVSVDDILPQYVTDPRNFQFSYDGSTWRDVEPTTDEDGIHFPGETLAAYNDQHHQTVYFRFTGTIAGVEDNELPSNTLITNTATANFNEETITSTATVLTRERTPKLTLSKAAGDPDRIEDSNISGHLYEIPYTLTVNNSGDALEEEDDSQVTDVMSGGLQPAAYPKKTEPGTILGTWRGPDGITTGISGTYTYDKVNDRYTILWDLPAMTGGTADEPSTGVISYTGFVVVPMEAENQGITSVNATNSASITGIFPGTQDTTILKVSPDPRMDKEIYKVNGQDPEDKRSYQIHVGDEITYKLTVRNVGNADTIATVSDFLPMPFANSGLQWVLGKNLFVSTSANDLKSNSADRQRLIGVDMDYNEESGSMVWTGGNIPAGRSYTIYVTLVFPGVDFTWTDEQNRSGVAQFIAGFVNQSGVNNLNNTMRMSAPDPENLTRTKTWTSTVNHTVRPTTLTVDKTSDKEGQSIQGGEDADVVFTISGFSTEDAVANMTLTDTLDDVLDVMDLKQITTGSYTGIESYSLTFHYIDGSSDVIENIPAGTVQTYTEDTAGNVRWDDVIALEWGFGTVPSLGIKSAPTITMTAKEEVRGNRDNYVTLHYNEADASDSTRVYVVYSGTLTKTATNANGDVNNETNQLKAGDYVTFTINYRNQTDGTIALDSDYPLVDYMNTGGLEPGKVTVSAYVVDEYNQRVNNAVSPAEIEITQADVESAAAKKTEFTLQNPLAPGEMLVISYRVQVSSAFEYSQTDKNLGKDQDWTPESGNSRLVYNQATVTENGTTIEAETDFFYGPGNDEVYFQKSVFALGGVYNNGVNNPGTYLQTVTASDSLDNFGLPYEAPSGYGGAYDSIRYTILVSNDINASQPLTVSYIVDKLPTNLAPTDSTAYTYMLDDTVYLGAVYYRQDNSYYYTACLTGTKNYSSYGNGRIDGLFFDKNSSSVTVKKETVPLLTTIPSNYTAVGATVTCDDVRATEEVTFTLTGSDGQPLVLQPGEVFAFQYMVFIDRSENDPVSWDNTATLHTEEDVEAAEENPGFQTNLHGRNLERNMDDGTKVDTATYEATVSIYPPEYKVGIDKEVTGRVITSESGAVTQGFTWDDLIDRIYPGGTVTGEGAYNVQEIGDEGVRFGDIVEWTVRVKNGGDIRILDLTLEDYLPYPYVPITSASGGYGNLYQGENVNVALVDGEAVTGDAKVIGDTTADYFGKADYYKITIDGIDLEADEIREFKIYTIYTGGSYYSVNYLNRAQILAERPIELPELTAEDEEAGITSWGSAVYDSSGQNIIGATDDDAVFPTFSSGSNSYKQVTEIKDDTPTKNATPASNAVGYIQIDQGGTVEYTLSVENGNSDVPYNNFILIDKLPFSGDTGTVNAATGRDSGYSMTMTSDPMVTIIQGGSETPLGPGEYSVSYTNAVNTEGFTTDDWDGGGSSFGSSDMKNATAFRLELTDPLASNATVRVTFRAQAGEDAKAGTIAWNSFGYAYTIPQGGGEIRYYAEPSKVGVWYPLDFEFTKVKAEASDTPLSGASFALYTNDAGNYEGLLDISDPTGWTQVGQTVTSGDDGLVRFDDLRPGTYRLVETQAPGGYIRPSGQWNIILAEDNSYQIQCKGDSQPPAFISRTDGSLALPNMQIVDFPESGGLGHFTYGVLGCLLIGGGALMLLSGLLSPVPAHGPRHRRKGGAGRR